ncbi:MAG: S1C family serine protease [Planctomycetia bacterium]
MTSAPIHHDSPGGGGRRTLLLFAGLVVLVGMIAWPSFMGRVQYARTRAELRAIRDAAKGAEMTTIGKLFTTLARVIGPTVVNVTSRRKATSLADEVAALQDGEVAGFTDESVGSGVVIDPDGWILTNYHVVAQSNDVTVTLSDGRRFIAATVGADPASDLAVLRIDAANVPHATWGDSDSMQVGEMAWAIGNPFGLDRTLTYGIVSAVGRRGVTEDPFQEFLQTDASINPGNSGGPLVDVHGHVMGITTAIVGQDFRGIGFAIPSNTARRVYEEIRRDGHVERGSLGISLRRIGTQDDPDDGMMLRGAVVGAVDPHSTGAAAGIRPGDVIVGFDDFPVDDPAALVLLITRAPIGTEVPLTVIRGGKQLTLTARIGRRPS